MRFAQRIALITGAGSGIGREVAIRLAREGAKVVLVGRRKPKLEAVANEINKTKKIPMAEIFQADVTDEEDVQELSDYIRLHFGDLHILVNNAGSSQSSKILETSEGEWDDIQSANLRSVFLVSKMLGHLMVLQAKEENRRQGRAIVNVASLSGHHAGALIPHYSAAKAGVINFTRSLALELAPYGIRVNSVSPGFVDTPLTEKGLQSEKFVKMIEENTALGRIGKASEIANVIVFAASEEASYMTGSDILVDGGWIIK
ncbi:SDR family NAD(P)-dependent oxidoreductase [Robertmurraya sp. DFI.2.37]|uniref:SDR family NAD(P)-dependent oxidoreductase n=1 Tax=Robertmurraya sp. DFI.2.37 TaxID=3031819 RepID=UPI00124673E3|nr:SDR family oxidoreductase [Robertmurraya sp. DFI.2.37]MDF1507477.1 SDR family NAD(P)-dependent oxidoreductase [Robertmurraya sp. DFI.2.37]